MKIYLVIEDFIDSTTVLEVFANKDNAIAYIEKEIQGRKGYTFYAETFGWDDGVKSYKIIQKDVVDLQ